MRTNYILIDYENVQNIDLSSLKGKSFFIKIFVIAQRRKIDKKAKADKLKK
jgi:hypothetical protein